MSVLIAFVQTKGGVGKTTSAIYMASALAKVASVEVWDTDHQGSATEWADRAAEAGTPLEFPVEIMNRPMIKRRVQSTTSDYVIIDTPPGDPATIDAVIAEADVIILPAEASAMDMTRLWRTLEGIPHDKSRIALLTKVNKRTVAYREAKELLEESENLAVFSEAVPNKEIFKRSFGERITKLEEYENITAELVEALS